MEKDEWELNISEYILSYTRKHFPNLKKQEILNELQISKSKDYSISIPVINRLFARKEGKKRWEKKLPLWSSLVERLN